MSKLSELIRYLKQADINRQYKNEYRLAILEFAKCVKDIRDTIRPYKAKRQLFRDLNQPFWGIYNMIVGGLWGTVAAPIRAIVGLIGCVLDYFNDQPTQEIIQDFKATCIDVPGIFLSGYAQAVRGSLQFATSVLAIPRTLFRGALTWYTGWQSFEDKVGVERLINIGETLITINNNENTLSMVKILATLQRKCEKEMHWDGQKTVHIPYTSDSTQNTENQLNYFENLAEQCSKKIETLGGEITPHGWTISQHSLHMTEQEKDEVQELLIEFKR